MLQNRYTNSTFVAIFINKYNIAIDILGFYILPRKIVIYCLKLRYYVRNIDYNFFINLECWILSCAVLHLNRYIIIFG